MSEGDQAAPRSARNRENIQRVQVGLTGLAGIVIMIAMVNLIVNNVRVDATPVTAGSVSNAILNAANTTPKEPLAELGVAPAADQPKEGTIVPDLKPDPKLHKPMDQVAPSQR